MASDQEDFYQAGPSFLTAVDWNNFNHRRTVASSLVQGVYLMENDRRQNRQYPYAKAPPWWEFFHFKLIQPLVDNHDLSYFGAIFEYDYQPYMYNNNCHGFYSGAMPPRYVVAIRGTIRELGNRKEDFKLDLHLTINNLHNSTRFATGLDATQDISYKAGPGNLWLAGHSLGSSISLLIGRHMVRYLGIHVETYLFNPPFASPPFERITNEKIKFGMRIATTVVTTGLATIAGKASKNRANDEFTSLSTWVPYLFLNPSDPICSEYIGYFEHREKMEAIGAGGIGRIATMNSIGSLVGSAIGKNDCEALHLIPCGYLTINSRPCGGLLEDHGVHQWWKQDLVVQCKLHQYK